MVCESILADTARPQGKSPFRGFFGPAQKSSMNAMITMIGTPSSQAMMGMNVLQVG
jgi:hypothetical protein